MSATKLSGIKYTAYIGVLVSCALVLSLLENAVPFFGVMPGIKIGLANIVTMLTLFWFGPISSLSVGLLRSFLTAVLSGNLSMFFYSGAGTVLCVFVMYICEKLFSKHVSVIGRSMIGAFFFNVGQVSVASFAVSNIRIFSYLPVLTFVSTFCGILTGYITKKIMEAEYVRKK